MSASQIIGQKLRRAQQELGLTDERFSALIGSSYCNVISWVRHGYAGNMDRLALIHDALGIPLWELLPTEEELRGEPEVRKEE